MLQDVANESDVNGNTTSVTHEVGRKGHGDHRRMRRVIHVQVACAYGWLLMGNNIRNP